MLSTQGLARSKHSGVISAFREHFVKSGLVETEYSDIYGRVMDHRHIGDYELDLLLEDEQARSDEEADGQNHQVRPRGCERHQVEELQDCRGERSDNHDGVQGAICVFGIRRELRSGPTHGMEYKERCGHEPGSGRRMLPIFEAHYLLGEYDEAMVWLNRAIDERELFFLPRLYSAELASLRQDARFAPALARIRAVQFGEQGG